MAFWFPLVRSLESAAGHAGGSEEKQPKLLIPLITGKFCICFTVMIGT